MKRKIYFLLVTLLCLEQFVQAQIPVDLPDINPDLLKKFWPANWITCPDSDPKGYGVYHFRKTFDLEKKPEEFIIHVSADNRYILYVNGDYVTYGPARGDLEHWRFESIDISGQLTKGENVIASVVWNFGEYIPFSQMTNQTGFIISGNGPGESIINSDNSWKVLKNDAYQPISGFGEILNSFIVVGPGDYVDGSRYPWGWEQLNYDDSEWLQPKVITGGKPRSVGTNGDWMLVPREIDFMQVSLEPFLSVRRSQGIEFPVSYLNSGNDIRIPAQQKVSFLLDQGYLTKSYPRVIISQGDQAQITITYAEALFDDSGNKGNRNEIDGKKLIGNYDIFISDGGNSRIFIPLWFRTYRYIKVEIETKDEPLLLHQLLSSPTGYPLKQNSSFESDDERLADIWEVGFRTAKLCAGEIYYDCPYYEQMQYVGDTRIQALISLYVDGTDRLMRKAIKLYDNSRISDGLTQSRYPSSSLQIIPPYSLFWIAMIYDYWLHRNDPEFVRSYLMGIRNVMSWFEERMDDNNMLGPLEWWNFVDWADEWPWDNEKSVGGVPYGVAEGNSSIVTLQFAYALDMAAKLHEAFGEEYFAEKYKVLSEKIKSATYSLCWNEEIYLLSDSPEKRDYSQHANIFGILTDAVPKEHQKALIEKINNDKGLIQCTLYFRFYLVEALKKSGMADQYLDQLTPWYQMLNNGLTTFAEKPDPTRSDCHAWSASPNYDLLATVCGIMPGSPGFQTVIIKPNMGHLKNVKGKLFLPDYNDNIEVDLIKNGNKIQGKIYLPEGLSGRFIWFEKKMELKSGRQNIDF